MIIMWIIRHFCTWATAASQSSHC